MTEQLRKRTWAVNRTVLRGPNNIPEYKEAKKWFIYLFQKKDIWWGCDSAHCLPILKKDLKIKKVRNDELSNSINQPGKKNEDGKDKMFD